MNIPNVKIRRSGGGIAIDCGDTPMVTELGLGIPVDRRWRWSFDGSLRLVALSEQRDSAAPLGEYTALVLTYADETGPLVQQALQIYKGDAYLVVETTALRDLQGTALEDSFFHTTFNAPVARLADGLSYLTYTWGLQDREGAVIGGHFPDAAVAPDISSLPEQLRLAGFSPIVDVHQTTEKPFAPLIAYDRQGQTLVMSPLNHYLISPLRLVDTPQGAAVARGLHGAVDVIPTGTTTRTALVMGQGLVDTVLKWGDLLLRVSGKRRGKGHDSRLVKSLGFWNCYGGYYAELFRQTNADTLKALSQYFREAGLPVQYIGLDLWYLFDRVGFAKSYRPDPSKYPRGLKDVLRTTGLPLVLHMSAFEQINEYLDAYDFVVDEGSSYPSSPAFYQDRAREFKDWGAIAIWPDFLRTQLQNSRSLRERIGAADRWFDGLVRAMGQEGLNVMLCMPTMGHYLASAAYDNIIAVRTSTDYVNHQAGQLEKLRQDMEEYRIPNSPLRNLRQNLLLSLVAGAVGLAPSYDVFITNQEHPEGFNDPNAPREALARALSAGIVGLGDKVGSVDKKIVERLAFSDGTLAQPDHPPYPLVSTLQSDTPAFFTTTSIGDYRWTFVELFNLAAETRSYQVDLAPLLERKEALIYDYLGARTSSLVSLSTEGYKGVMGSAGKIPVLRGALQSGEARYWVIAPQVGALYPLGFLDKYVTMSGRQVKGVSVGPEGVIIDLELPVGKSYSFAVLKADKLSVRGRGVQSLSIEQGEGLSYVNFQVNLSRATVVIAPICSPANHVP